MFNLVDNFFDTIEKLENGASVEATQYVVFVLNIILGCYGGQDVVRADQDAAGEQRQPRDEQVIAVALLRREAPGVGEIAVTRINLPSDLSEFRLINSADIFALSCP